MFIFIQIIKKWTTLLIIIVSFFGSFVFSGNETLAQAWPPPPVPVVPACNVTTHWVIYSSPYGNLCWASSACGVTFGTVGCSGCSATAPALPSGYGNSCSASNSCGATNSGTIGCSGSCSATAPAMPSGYGNSCSASSACGTGYGSIGCSGCTATAPALPSGYGNSCTAISECGLIGNGTITCSGCNAIAPICPPVPGACGASDGKSFYTAPTSELCSAGTPSAVTSTGLVAKYGPWHWLCNGLYGGVASSYCNALEKPMPDWKEVGK